MRVRDHLCVLCLFFNLVFCAYLANIRGKRLEKIQSIIELKKTEPKEILKDIKIILEKKQWIKFI